MNDPHTPLKVLNTTSPKASKAMYDFCDELVGVVPGVEYVQRKKGKGFEVGSREGVQTSSDCEQGSSECSPRCTGICIH